MSVAWLQGELTTLAFCWRVERRDGVAIGFTAHDRDLNLGGIVYRAAPGMAPSAIAASDGFEVDTLDVGGALSHDAIRAEDLAAGRWDGARLTLFAVDWSDPGSIVDLARGELGEVAVRDDAFTAELRGPTALLERAVIETTSPECRAELGDRRCRVDLAGRRRVTTVIEAIDESRLRLATGEPVADGYGYGRLRWLSGPASGLSAEIAGSAGDVVMLREPIGFGAEAGALIEIVEGCDRSLATCAGRFANAINFRGEPHLPGMDLLTRYPGA